MSGIGARLDDLVRGVLPSDRPAGFAAAVLIDDELYESAHGVANPELDAPLTEGTLVQIGSVTKMLNAALILRLVEECTLDLDQAICEVVTDFQLPDEGAARALTLRHCLTMTSGLDMGSYAELGFDDACMARYVAELAEVPVLFPPGCGFSYSNAGSVVAGHAAERATGRRWDDLLREHVLDPAGMAQTETLTDRLLYHPVAVGITESGEVTRPWYWTRSTGPSGGTCASTAGDLTRFAHVFLSGGQGLGGERVLSAETVAAMTEPLVPVPTELFGTRFWCLGPQWADPGTTFYGHLGGNRSGCALLWWIPNAGAAIACVSNSVWLFEAMLDVGSAIAEELGYRSPLETETDEASQPGGHEPTKLPGVYERLEARYEVSVVDGELSLRVEGRGPVFGDMHATSRLIPTGPDRFVPDTSLRGGRVPNPVAFPKYAGKRILLDGVFGARRISDPA